MSIKPITFLGINIFPIRLRDLLTFIEKNLQQQNKFKVFYLNIHGANLANQFPDFRQIINQAEMVICDGVGVRLGVKFLGKDLPERMTPPDWIGKLCQLCENYGYSIYLLGSENGVAEQARDVLLQHYPALHIAGVHHGFFDKHLRSSENQALVSQINQAKPDVLVVGFGMPHQEQWIIENFDDLNVKMFFAVGAMLDYVAGITRRTPRWASDIGFEWLGRLLVEPSRLWRRYLFGIPVFIFHVVKNKVGYPVK